MVLAFALGSIPKARPGGSLLLNSWWLVYLLSLAPVLGIGLMLALIILLIYNSRTISEGLGFGLARRRRISRKKFRELQLIIWMAVWGFALVIQLLHCGGLFCRSSQSQSQTAYQIINSVSGNRTISTLPILQVANQFSTLFASNWYYAAFLGLLVVCSVILVRAEIISWEEARAGLKAQKQAARLEATASVEDAFRILKTQTEADPRTRIINCYQRMVNGAQSLGASITSDQTARELENGIRDMLRIKGASMRELTNLFEEARYSLHEITENNAETAQQCLLSIAEEMNITLSS